MDLLRKCPNCGKRFSVRLERRELVDRERDTIRVVHDVTMSNTRLGGPMAPMTAIAEQVPIERSEFKMTYQCGHCGHEWSEMVPVVKREGKGPTTDIKLS